MIIKLTEIRNSAVRDGAAKKPELHTIYVNVNQIQCFAKSINGNDTRLQLQGSGYIFVKESCEQVVDMLAPKPIRAVEMNDLIDADMREVGHITYGAR